MKNNKNICQMLYFLTMLTLSQNNVANYNVDQLTKDPKNWATWGGNYAGTRYSIVN